MAATKVGTTKGSIRPRSSKRRPGNSSRASTQAMGRPSSKDSAQVIAACASDHSMRQRKYGSAHGAHRLATLVGAALHPTRPQTSKRSAGATSTTSKNSSGNTGSGGQSQPRWRRLRSGRGLKRDAAYFKHHLGPAGHPVSALGRQCRHHWVP